MSLDLKWHCFVSHTSVSKNKEAAKSLLVHLSQPSSIEKLVVASGGYDLPAYEKLMTLQVWERQRVDDVVRGNAVLMQCLLIEIGLNLAHLAAEGKRQRGARNGRQGRADEMIGVPVLAGSAGYALAEAMGWNRASNEERQMRADSMA